MVEKLELLKVVFDLNITFYLFPLCNTVHVCSSFSIFGVSIMYIPSLVYVGKSRVR